MKSNFYNNEAIKDKIQKNTIGDCEERVIFREVLA